MKIRAGELKEQLTFLEATNTPDGKGGSEKEWQVRDKRRAKKLTKGTKSFHAVSQRFTQATDVFILREYDVDPAWVVKHEQDTYRIVGVEVEDRYTLLVCECETQGAHTHGSLGNIV